MLSAGNIIMLALSLSVIGVIAFLWIRQWRQDLNTQENQGTTGHL